MISFAGSVLAVTYYMGGENYNGAYMDLLIGFGPKINYVLTVRKLIGFCPKIHYIFDCPKINWILSEN